MGHVKETIFTLRGVPEETGKEKGETYLKK